MKLVSIVVPSFNYVNFLSQCLESIQTQSYPKFEVLICDGGSTDGSLDIIERYTKLDSRFRIISQSDRGQSDAIYKGFAAANGEIFCFLNADDILLKPDVFQLIIDKFNEDDELGVVTCSGFYIDENSRIKKKVNYHYHPFVSRSNIKLRLGVLQPATFWKRKIFFQGVWRRDMHYVFDVVFFYHAFMQHKWVFYDIPLAGYRIHNSNKSVGVKSQRIFELAEFEKIKFGNNSFRERYLIFVGNLVELSEKSRHARLIQKFIYLSVNSISFITLYRLPSI
jgi:glycosyltransferase involved in cell wall biosynthesis